MRTPQSLPWIHPGWLSDRVVKVMHSKCIGKFSRRFESCGSRRNLFEYFGVNSTKFISKVLMSVQKCPFSLVVEHSLRKRKVPRSIRGGGTQQFLSSLKVLMCLDRVIASFASLIYKDKYPCDFSSSDSSVGRAFGCYTSPSVSGHCHRKVEGSKPSWSDMFSSDSKWFDTISVSKCNTATIKKPR